MFKISTEEQNIIKKTYVLACGFLYIELVLEVSHYIYFAKCSFFDVNRRSS